jgi:hypothetical protein
MAAGTFGRYLKCDLPQVFVYLVSDCVRVREWVSVHVCVENGFCVHVRQVPSQTPSLRPGLVKHSF